MPSLLCLDAAAYYAQANLTHVKGSVHFPHGLSNPMQAFPGDWP